MAILKHIPIRNSDYGAAQRYLLFEHDPKTQKQLLDENGDMILRKGIIQSALLCDPFSFNTECTELNKNFHKNNARDDVKAHHFILSFDPRDAVEHGLTAEKAHMLAEEFSRYFFAGHQTFIVTHPDGSNHSGNIHTHIIINSLRKENRAWQEYMERPIDALAGYKHHQTPPLLKLMLEKVNELCEREHLYTVDLSLPADKKRTDREYHAEKQGQQKLDEVNRPIIADGLYPRKTKFETIKDSIRNAIDATAKEAKSENEFVQLLRDRYDIIVKQSRGRWSYIHSEREKPISGRSLGYAYEKEAVILKIAGIAIYAEQSNPEYASLPRIFLIHSDLHLVVDVQNCVKAQQSRAYARKVTISNLQQMARSVAYLQEHSICTLDKLQKLREDAETQYKAASNDVRETQTRLTAVNTQLHYMGQYLSGKKLYAEFLVSTDKPAFRAARRPEIDEYEAAVAYLKAIPDKKGFVLIDNLRKEKDALQKELTHKKSVLRPLAKQRRTLGIIAKNVQTLLQPQSTFVASRTTQKQDRDTL